MDDIRRKLALIDKQLSGGFVNSYHRVISTSPLVFAAVGLILGILIQNALPASQLFWLILLIASAVSAVLLFVNQRKVKLDSYATVLLSACALIGFACLGAIRLITFYSPEPDDIRNFVGNEKNLTAESAKSAEKELKLNSADSAYSAVKEDVRRLATVRGLIITDPYINRNENWKFARFEFTDPDTSFYLTLGEIKTVDSWSKVSGTIRAQVAEPIFDLKAGDFIQAYCWLDRFESSTNPGEFDIAEYLARKNVFVAASIQSREAIEVLENSSTGTFIKIKRRLQKIASQALRGELDAESQNYALLQALVLGYRTEIDSNTYRAFQKTGLLHFVCLSGMNFMILFWIIWWLCKAAGLMKRACAVICLAAAGIFLLVIPPQSPAIRAAIMSSVFCASFFFRRKYNPFNALSLAALILLLIKPTELFDAGWQLSFAIVLGLLLFCARINFFLYEKITGLSWSKKAPKTGLLSRVVPIAGPYLLRLFSTCITAWLVSAGISLYHFYRINWLTSIWTVIVSPLIGVISVIGYLKTILALFLPSAAALLDIIVGASVSLLIRLVKFMAGLNISEILIGKVSPVMVILYYAFLLFAFFVHFRKPFMKKLTCTVVALVIIVYLGSAKWHRTYRDNLVLTCLDVGHGQAILAQLPGKANILFDVGSLHTSDIGRRIVAPFLDYSGLSKIDAIIISHNDLDHINGIPEIIEHCKVGKIYANDAFFDEAQNGGAAKFLKNCLLKQGHEIQTLDENLSLQSDANIKIIWPAEQLSQEDELSDNDRSTVCLIEFADKKILLCSDIEKLAQRELLHLYPQLKADIVVVPHHGSVATADPDFLDALDADILLCSCGRSQYEKQQVIENKDNSKVFYTPRDGAITIRIKKGGTIATDVFIE